MSKFTSKACAVLAALCCFHPLPASAGEINVSAAASLRDALSAVADAFRKERPDVTVRFNFGSSTTLQQQIQQGAPVDLFLAAADRNVNELAQKGHVAPDSKRIVAQGDLVLIAPKNSSVAKFSDLRTKKVRVIAVAGQSVPAGRYARQAIYSLKLSGVGSKLVNAKDVRAALNLVATGNADAGFVYRTDALVAGQVKIVAQVPARAHAPIRYPLIMVKDAPNARDAKAFWSFIQSTTARKVWKRYGFR